MKKTFKVVALIAVLSASLCVLTGCGEDKKQNTAAQNKPASSQTQTTNTSKPASNNNSSASNADDATEPTTSSNSGSETGTVIQVPMQVRNMVPDTTITELYLSGAGLDNWGEDLLGGQQMPTGTQMTLNFNIDKNNVKWDIRATDETGTPVEFRNLDLSNVSTQGGVITLQMENGTPIATAE